MPPACYRVAWSHSVGQEFRASHVELIRIDEQHVGTVSRRSPQVVVDARAAEARELGRSRVEPTLHEEIPGPLEHVVGEQGPIAADLLETGPHDLGQKSLPSLRPYALGVPEIQNRPAW